MGGPSPAHKWLFSSLAAKTVSLAMSCSCCVFAEDLPRDYGSKSGGLEVVMMFVMGRGGCALLGVGLYTSLPMKKAIISQRWKKCSQLIWLYQFPIQIKLMSENSGLSHPQRPMQQNSYSLRKQNSLSLSRARCSNRLYYSPFSEIQSLLDYCAKCMALQYVG